MDKTCTLIILVSAIVAANGFTISNSIVDHQSTDPPKLPSYIKICKRDDPFLNDCVKDSVEEIRPYLKKGIPELHIPPCEPLVIPELVMNQGKGSVTVQSKYTDVHVYGPTDFRLQEVKVDLDRDRVRLKLFIPRLETIGNYSISGRILMLPISGNGVSSGNYTDIEATVLMQGEKVVKNNKTYMRVRDFFIDFTIGHARVHLTNLFNGDEQLGDAMNEFLNDNWKNVAQEMKPVLEKTISDLFKKFTNKFYSVFPIDILLPE